MVGYQVTRAVKMFVSQYKPFVLPNVPQNITDHWNAYFKSYYDRIATKQNDEVRLFKLLEKRLLEVL
jgi:hypothetical protein